MGLLRTRYDKKTIRAKALHMLRPQTLQGESVVKSGKLLLIIPSLSYDSDINEGYRKLSKPLFEKILLGQKHQREVEKEETVSQTLIVSI